MRTKTFIVKKDGKNIAVLTYGKKPHVRQNADGQALLAALEKKRFVFNPETSEVAVYPTDERFRTDPAWWLLYVQEALWPDYSMRPKAPALGETTAKDEE